MPPKKTSDLNLWRLLGTKKNQKAMKYWYQKLTGVKVKAKKKQFDTPF